MKTVREITEFIGTRINRFPLCVEVGCTYVCQEGNEVHTTTNNILDNIVVPNEGALLSFDLDAEHIAFAKDFVSDTTYVDFIQGNSLETLKLLSPYVVSSSLSVDLLCLDSGDFDPLLMVREYMTVYPHLSQRHYVLADDIHNPNSVKADRMVPLLKELGYEWREATTPTGMFVASKGYDLW